MRLRISEMRRSVLAILENDSRDQKLALSTKAPFSVLYDVLLRIQCGMHFLYNSVLSKHIYIVKQRRHGRV